MVSCAKDALTIEHFADQPDWSLPHMLFRWEAYNAFNHPNFALPASTNIDGTNFGQITNTSSTSGDQNARVLQFALRLDF